MRIEIIRIVSKYLGSFYKISSDISGIAAGVAVCCGALLIFVAVIARYVFNYGVVFAAEYTCYLTAFLCFVGAVYTQSVKGHIKVNLLLIHLPGRVQQWLEAITLALSLIVCVVLFYWFVVMTKCSFDFGTRALTAVSTPLVIPQSFAVLGLSLLCITIMMQVSTAIKRLKKG